MIISVVSGRSGAGKTLVATSLAVSLRDTAPVQFLDCVAEEPDAHLFLRPSLERRETVVTPVPRLNLEACTYCGRCAEVCTRNAVVAFAKHVLLFPELCMGCGACSYICPQKAITEEKREIGVIESGEADGMGFVHGRLAVGETAALPVIKRVKERAGKGTVIVDAAAGTSRPVVEAVKGSDFSVIVTEPNPSGLAPVRRVVEVLARLRIPGGFILNGAGDAGGEVEAYCRQQGLPVLLNIPMERRIARLYSEGVTLAEGLPEWREGFAGMVEKIREIIGERDSRS